MITLALVACGSLDPLADTDSDGLIDALEIAWGLDPESADSDGDELTDSEEHYIYGTDPTLPDTDNDGALDGWEVARGRRPLDPQHGPYTTGHPMLTMAEKERLEPTEWDIYGRTGAKLKRTTLHDVHEAPFDSYDLARRGRWMLLNSAQGPYYVYRWVLEDLEPPPDVPEWIKQYVQDSVVDLVTVFSILTSTDFPVYRTWAAGVPESYDTIPPNMLFYADDHAALWAFLNRPIGDHHFWLIDDKMVIRAVDDFPLMKRLIDEGLP